MRLWISTDRRGDRFHLAAVLASLTVLVGCGHAGSSDTPKPDADSPPDTAVPIPDARPDVSTAPRYLCHEAAPPNAPQPVPPPMPATCPALVSGHNTIISTGHTRDFILVLPSDPQPGETFPVLFMWHWLGGSADGFLQRGDVQTAADEQRFIAVIPTAEGATVALTTFNTKWPFDVTQSQQRMDEEFTFFDDMLACAEAQYPVDQNCVSTIGVSAGALFTDQLAQARSNRLASFVSLSGGVGDTIIKPWTGTGTHKLPAVVLWGGDGPPMMDGNKDILGCFGVGMDFSVASRDMEAGLEQDGHFFIECKHNCGHVEPPLEAPPGESKYAGIWDFALDHPFWLNPGDSPFLSQGLPAGLPSWCAIGPGHETPRSGSGCPAAENPCVE